MDDRKPKAADIPDVEILSLIDAHSRDRSPPWAFEVLMARGIPEKVVYAKYRQLDRRKPRIIECGVSLRTAWLTDEGRRLLATLRVAGKPPNPTIAQ